MANNGGALGWFNQHVANPVDNAINTSAKDVAGGLESAGKGINTGIADADYWSNRNIADPIGRALTGHNIAATGSPAPTPQQNTGTSPTAPPTKKSNPIAYQAAIATAVAPLMKQLSNLGNASTINSALAATPDASAALSAEPSLASGISQSIQSQVADYKSGLNTMLKYSGTETQLQDLVKGIGELISYPVALPGQQNTPSSVSQNSVLDTIYNTLNNMRNYGTSSTTSSNSNYNASIADILGGSTPSSSSGS